MALPQPQQPNNPNLNVGLGGVANNNTPLAAANENRIPQNAQLQNEVASRLAADRAAKSAEQRFQKEADGSDESEENPEDYDFSEDGQNELLSQQNTRPQNTRNQTQAQLNQNQQAQAATAMASQRQNMIMQLKRQEAQMDQEAETLIKQLNGFKQTRTKRFLSFFKPNITFLVDNLIESLKKQATHGSFKARIAFLTGALTTIAALIGTLKAFKLFTAFMDAAFVDRWSCLQIVIKTLETIVIPIIIILISPLWISFLALLFFIGKFPLLKGKMTDQVTKMVEKLEKQRTFWQAQLAKLQEIVARQNQRKALEKQEKQMQRTG